MSLLSEIKGLEYKQGLLFATAFFGMVASGFLIVFQFRPELIEKYDILKIVFLSLALTMPLVTINVIQITLRPSRAEFEDKKLLIGAAMFVNVFVIYVPLLVCYLFSLRFRWFLGLVSFIELWWLIPSLCQRFFKKTKA
jgi:hypothetical protein